jgi:hypothetical protein
MSLDELFYEVDDFCLIAEKWVAQQALLQPAKKRGPKSKLSLSEVMTIIIWFHMSHYRTFKNYYHDHVQKHLRSEFPGLVSYTRFVELMPAALPFLCLYMRYRMGSCTGISFIDSTRLPVCHNKRIQRHKVFAGLAARGKSSMGWFFGFKLHLVVNEYGEILSFCLTPGNDDDRKPVPQLAKELFGKLFGDKGYLSQALFEQLYDQGVQLITPIRKNMQNKLMPLEDKLISRKRSIIETINDQLKNISQILHTRHRSVTNFSINLIAGLIAYTHQEKKPSLNLSENQRNMLPAVI